MKKSLILVLFLIIIPCALAGEKYNSVIGARDFCVTIETEDQTTSNATCLPVRVPNHTLFNYGTYYSYVGVNWDDLEDRIGTRAINWDDIYQAEIQAEAINWDDLRDNIGTVAINWDDIYQAEIQAEAINWDDIAPLSPNKALCVNSLGFASTCSSIVAVDGSCTCN